MLATGCQNLGRLNRKLSEVLCLIHIAGAKKLLEQNGFIATQQLVLCLRNYQANNKEIIEASAARTTLRTTDEMVYYLLHQSSIY